MKSQQQAADTPAPQSEVQARLQQGGLSNAAMQQRLGERLGAQVDLLRRTGATGPKGPLPFAAALRESFGEAVDDVQFTGGAPEAAWACASLGARAYADGNTIVCADAAPPMEIIAHELTHVAQGAGGGPASGTSSPGSAAEREASAVGAGAGAGGTVSATATPQAGAVHPFPGFGPLPFDIPIPNPFSGLVEQVVRELAEAAVEAVVDTVCTTIEDVCTGIRDVVVGIGQGIVDGVVAVGDSIGDALNLRENEDLLDLEEDVATGTVAAPAGAVSAVFAVLRKVRAGEEVTPEERAAAAATVNALSNDDMRNLLHALDRAGLLMEVSRQIFGEAPAEGETDMFEVPVQTWRFWNASDDISTDVARANEIYHPHDIHIQGMGARLISKTQVEGIVGHEVPNDFGLDRSKTTDASYTFTHPDMVAVVQALGVGQIVSGLWVPTVVNDTGDQLSGTSTDAADTTHGVNIAFVTTDNSGPDTFAHELGHILTHEGHFEGDDNNLMTSGGTRDKDAVGDDRLTDEQVENIRDDLLGYMRS